MKRKLPIAFLLLSGLCLTIVHCGFEMPEKPDGKYIDQLGKRHNDTTGKPRGNYYEIKSDTIIKHTLQ